MLNHVIAFSLNNRLLVLAAAWGMVLFGSYQATQLTIDVFPDLSRPTVTMMTEAPGLAPEEVETLVTFPIESAMNGASRVLRVRSSSGIGISIVHVEFDWNTDIFLARQIVAEKLQLIRARLPQNSNPVMTPVTSIMGEIMLVGMRPAGEATPLDVRTTADWVVRQRLLAVAGVAQVTVMGGELKQYQVLTSPERLAHYDVALDELTRAVEKSNVVAGGGFLLSKQQETLIRIVGRATSLEDIEQTVVRLDDTVPITVRQVADVRFAGPVRRGDGSVNGRPAVILSIQKQPGADTLALTAEIERTLSEIQATLPDVEIETDIFKQATFIEVAVGNVEEAIRDGALWVVVVLFIFLWNLRTSLITLTAIPLSILIAVLVFTYFGISINTMTLGGLAVAIGEIVDDSIVDVENIYRRLKENRHLAQPENPLRVVYRASSEIRNTIVYTTYIVALVVLPLFSLAGLEGRMFAPLGLSYLITLVASLTVSLTVTPVLASYLLPAAKSLQKKTDPFLLRWLKRADVHLLRFVLRHHSAVLVGVTIAVLTSLACLPWMGGEFLPNFNEGTLTIEMTAPPGTSLEESNRLAARAERMLMDVPEVTHVSRRTGRAELDEHAENVNYSEIDVGLKEPERPRPGWHYAALRAVPGLRGYGVDRVGRPRELVLGHIREILGRFPASVAFSVGQPISHRLDHIMSGIQAQIAVKLYGPDLPELREQAAAIEKLMHEVPGVVDLRIEPQVDVPQLRVTVLREEAARYGLPPADIAEALQTALQGRTVSQVLEGQRVFDLVVWFDEEARNDIDVIRNTLITTPSGARVKLGAVADVARTAGPNTINRENVMRRIVVQANTAGRDLASVVQDIRAAVDGQVVPALPPAYFVEYGGQFEAQQAANFRLLVFGLASVAAIYLLLIRCLGSWRAALQVMANIPQAALGAIVALLIVNWPGSQEFAAAPWWQWPRVWLEHTSLSVAHWVGFITLIGIVSRNGIMMISHYLHLMKYEGETFGEAMIIRGSLERLAPVLMTALTTIMGLIPLALGAGQTGKEILHPLAVVVIGGLVSSTLLDQIVTPALFLRFGQPAQPSDAQSEIDDL